MKLRSSLLLAGLSLATGVALWLPGGAEPVANAIAPLAAGGTPAVAAPPDRRAPPDRLAAAETPKPTAPDARQTGFGDLWLLSHGFAPGSPAAARLVRLLDAHQDAAGVAPHLLQMRPGADALPVAGVVPVALSTHQRYVHASLPAHLAGGADAVLLRWRALDRTELIAFEVQTVATGNAGDVPLWRLREDDWPPGRYRLEVLSANPDLRLLAAANFEITPTGASQNAFEYPIAPR